MLINALRSNKYKQGQLRLREKETDNYCCLGVATDLYFNQTGQGHWYSNSEVQQTSMIAAIALPSGNFRDQRVHLDRQIADWYGITEEGWQHMIKLNDDDDTSFKEIADLLDTELTKKKGK